MPAQIKVGRRFIKSISTNTTQICEMEEDIDEAFRVYFINIFTSFTPTVKDMD